MPDYSAQTGRQMSTEQIKAWVDEQRKPLSAAGCEHARLTYDPIRRVYLMEGWKIRPSPEPAPEFHLKAREVAS